jgi:DNA-binding transcriptional ArsR family regulator
MFVVFLALALICIGIAAFLFLTNFGITATKPFPGGQSRQSLSSLEITILRTVLVALGLVSWIALTGLTFIWRGRTRSMWLKLGFDQNVFELFIKMKGAPTRLKVLETLVATSKDRAQISEELGLDWKAVDRHVVLLERYGIVKESSSQGATKFYGLTPLGNSLLQLMSEMKREVERRERIQ